ncbi:MAG TPA: amidohydrolase family protein, partial [Bacillota bacterium]|nr:amidohydrolase family protein [Bacillota bacterium]
NPSYLTRREGSSGRIAKGCPADMVVLSDDVFSVPRDLIKDIGVVRTIVDGQETFRQGNAI